MLALAVLLGISRVFVTYTYPRSVFVVRDRDTAGAVSLRVLDEDDQSWDELSRLTRERPDDLVSVGNYSVGRLQGILFPTRQTNWPRLAWIGKPFPVGEEPRIRELAAAWLDEENWHARASFVRRSEPTTVLWRGHVLNVLTTAVAIMAVWSWGWMLLIPSWIRGARHRRGVCIRCKYDVSKTPGDATGVRICPECGAPNPPSEAATASG